MEPTLKSPVPALLEGPVDMLKASWALYKTNWKILTTIVLIPSVLITAGNILNIGRNPAMVVIGGIVSICGAILAVAMQPAAITAIHRLHNESSAALTVKEQYRIGFKYFWSVILLMITQGLIILGSGVLFVVPAIIVSIFLATYLFALILDGKKGFSAFTESYSLVKGRWWGVLGRILFSLLVFVIGTIVISGLHYILLQIFGIVPKSSGGDVIFDILNLILGAVLGPLFIVYIYRMYNSLKSTRLAGVPTEGFKKWLVFFLIVGILALMVMIILGMISVFLAQVLR